MSRRRAKRKSNKGLTSRKPTVPSGMTPNGEYVVSSNPEKPSVIFHGSMFQGPTPPPSILQAYCEIYPDAARVIFESYEKQGQHRRELESQHMRHSIHRSWGGLVAATVIALAALGLGGFAIYMGQNLLGLASLISTLGGLAVVFLRGQSQQRMERESRAKIMTGR